MDLKLSDEVMSEALNMAADKAIKNAFDSYEVRDAIQGRVANEVVGSLMKKAMDEAISKIDVSKMAQTLAIQLQRNSVAAALNIMRDGMVDIIFRIRGYSQYDADAKEKRAAIRLEMVDGDESET